MPVSVSVRSRQTRRLLPSPQSKMSRSCLSNSDIAPKSIYIFWLDRGEPCEKNIGPHLTMRMEKNTPYKLPLDVQVAPFEGSKFNLFWLFVENLISETLYQDN